SSSSSSVQRLSDATRRGAASAVPAPGSSARLAAKSDAKTRIDRPSWRIVADHVLIIGVEGILHPGIEFELRQDAIADPERAEQIIVEPDQSRRELVEIGVQPRPDISEAGAPGEAVDIAPGREVRAAARPAHLAHLGGAGRVRLARMEPRIIGLDVQPVGMTP